MAGKGVRGCWGVRGFEGKGGLGGELQIGRVGACHGAHEREGTRTRCCDDRFAWVLQSILERKNARHKLSWVNRISTNVFAFVRMDVTLNHRAGSHVN